MATQLATTDARPMNEADRFTLMQRQAQLFAFSPLIPEALRKGSPEQAMANCYIAMTIADRMGEDRMTVMQNIHVIHGTAGFKTKYMIARANASGKFSDDIDWEIAGQGGTNLSATAFATLAKSGKRVSMTVDMAMAKAEGWTSNKKYQTMPEVMLRYRSASFLINLYAPEVMLGYQTVEEREDIVAASLPTAAADYRPLSATMIEHRGEDTVTAEEPNAGEGRDDSQMGEGFTEADPATGELFEDPAATRIAEIRSKIDNAKDIDVLGAVMAENRSHMAAMSEDVTADLWKAHARRKASFAQGAK